MQEMSQMTEIMNSKVTTVSKLQATVPHSFFKVIYATETG